MFEVHEVEIASIKVGERARKSTGDIESLQFSIKRNGLLNPITVDEHYNLAAGERRLRACEGLEWNTIPCRVIPGLTAENLPLIEWIENVEREGFTWIEDLELKAKMHALWKEEHGQWGYRDTAARMGVSLGGLSSDLALAEALEYFPELKEYKTKSKAREGYKRLNASAEAIMATKNLSSDEQAQLEKLLANSSEKAEPKRVPNEASVAEAPPVDAPTTEEAAPVEPKKVQSEKALPEFVYEIMSYERLLGKLPSGVVGFAELDPPYAIDYAYHDEDSTELDSDWTIDQLEDAMDYILGWLAKNMLDNSWILCWTGYEHTTWINELAKSKGFGIQPPGIWYKPNGGRTAVPSVKMQSNYESFLLFRHGKATFNTPSFSSVVSCESVTSGRVHKWEKPIDLYRKFFNALGRENLYFLSPFAGSGNAMVTSALYGMTPVGCDVAQKHFYSFYNTLKNYYMEASNGR
jgi:ParB family chromosome partitioning protein